MKLNLLRPRHLSYKPVNPDWFYSHIDIPNMEDMRLEVLTLLREAERLYQTNPHYVNIIRRDLEGKIPETEKYFKSVGIWDKFNRILFSVAKELSSPIHVDDYGVPEECTCALNIPLVDCENSYMGFYESDEKHLYVSTDFGVNRFVKWGGLQTRDCKELARCDSTKPAVVNTTVLHNGVAEKTSRNIASFRFMPPLDADDLKRIGIKTPFVQEQPVENVDFLP